MSEIVLPTVVTAIANPEVEGFVAGTLFSQGWNVIFRALDFDSLRSFMETDLSATKNVVLIYSSDLPGITASAIDSLHGKVRQVVGFESGSTRDADFVGLLAVPKEESELLNLVRGFVRAPLVRNPSAAPVHQRRARVIAIGSPAGGAGCTTLAINLAMELSALGKETFLLDADVRNPAVAALLSLHKLDGEERSRMISSHLNVGEFTRERVANLSDYLGELVSKHDFVIIDLGSIGGVSDSLTDRRWTSTMVHWSCEQADDLWLLSGTSVLAIHRLESLVRDLAQVSIRAKISLGLVIKERGRKSKVREEQFAASVATIHAKGIFTLPHDPRSIAKAEAERATLMEIEERSPLRKCIAKIAGELSS